MPRKRHFKSSCLLLRRPGLMHSWLEESPVSPPRTAPPTNTRGTNQWIPIDSCSSESVDQVLFPSKTSCLLYLLEIRLLKGVLYKYSTTLLFLVFWLQVFLQEPRLTRHTQALTLALLTYPTIRLPPRGQTDSLADGSLVASSTELSRKPRYLFC